MQPNVLVAHNTLAGVAEASELSLRDQLPAELERIIMAESGGNQFCTAALARDRRYEDCYSARIGKPLWNVNSDGTTDIGIAQINDWHWGQKAIELGFDLDTEEGNLGFALWLYRTRRVAVECIEAWVAVGLELFELSRNQRGRSDFDSSVTE
jgi:hypothetical protein